MALESTDMRRRTLLTGIASATTIPVLAGCSDGGNGTGPYSGNDPGSASPSIETLAQTEVDEPDASGRNVESTATVSVDGDTVTIEGQLEASTPCHEAVVTDVVLEGGTLKVAVGLEESSDGGMCAQVISKIEYEATIEIENGTPTRVVVVHTDRVGEETAADVEL